MSVFFSRAFINYGWDVNVFVEYTSPLSLAFYAAFASFVVFINDLPSINLSFLKPWFVSDLLHSFLFGRHTIEGDDFSSNISCDMRDKMNLSMNYNKPNTDRNYSSRDNQRSSRSGNRSMPQGSQGNRYVNRHNWGDQLVNTRGYDGRPYQTQRSNVFGGSAYWGMMQGPDRNQSCLPYNLCYTHIKNRIIWYGWAKYKGSYSNYGDFSNRHNNNDMDT